MEIPNLVKEIIEEFSGEKTEEEKSSRKLRSAEEILEDYGLKNVGGEIVGKYI